MFSILLPYDISLWIEQVVVGGESGYDARPYHFDWVKELHDLCFENNVSFWFKRTGAKFIKDTRLYHLKRQLQHSQARKAGINIP